MKKEILIVLVTSLGLNGLANAACSPFDCVALGYSKMEDACKGASTIRCPFNVTKVNCVEKSTNCSVGDIYYTDGTCDANVIAGKTPVGVVGYVTKGGKHGGVIALTEAKQYWSKTLNNVSCLPDLGRYEGLEMNGLQNTQCIMSQTNDTYPAAAYCNGYAAVSTGKGSNSWYLPAVGELSSLNYSYEKINLSLSKLSKTQLSTNFYWSSSEYNNYIAWDVRPSDGKINDNSFKTSAKPVRCVLAF